jgi:hypothetical protein
MARIARALVAPDVKQQQQQPSQQPQQPQNAAATGPGSQAAQASASTPTGERPGGMSWPGAGAILPMAGPVIDAVTRTAMGAAAVTARGVRSAADVAAAAVPGWVPRLQPGWLPSLPAGAIAHAGIGQPAGRDGQPPAVEDHTLSPVCGRGVCIHWTPPQRAYQRAVDTTAAARVTIPFLPPQVASTMANASRVVHTAVGVAASWPPVRAVAHGLAAARYRLPRHRHHVSGHDTHAVVLLSDAASPAKVVPFLARSARDVPVVTAFLQQPHGVSASGLADPVPGVGAALTGANPRPAAALVLMHQQRGSAVGGGSDTQGVEGPAATSPSAEDSPPRAWATIGTAITERIGNAANVRRLRAAGAGGAVAVEATADGWGESGIQPAGLAALRHAVHSALHAHDDVALRRLADSVDTDIMDDEADEQRPRGGGPPNPVATAARAVTTRLRRARLGAGRGVESAAPGADSVARAKM